MSHAKYLFPGSNVSWDWNIYLISTYAYTIYTLNPISFKALMEDIYNCPMNPESYPTVDGWNPANHMENLPLFTGSLYISGGAGFLPSTVSLGETKFGQKRPHGIWASEPFNLTKFLAITWTFFKWGTITISTTMPSLQRGSILTKEKGATTFQYCQDFMIRDH